MQFDKQCQDTGESALSPEKKEIGFAILILIIVFYVLPVYLVFFHFKWLPLTRMWKIVLPLPTIFAFIFVWYMDARLRSRRDRLRKLKDPWLMSIRSEILSLQNHLQKSIIAQEVVISDD